MDNEKAEPRLRKTTITLDPDSRADLDYLLRTRRASNWSTLIRTLIQDAARHDRLQEKQDSLGRAG